MRKITEADMPRLLQIEQLTQEAPWSEEVFMRCLTVGYDCWGVDENNQLIGFIMMSSVLTGESHILNLCVTPEYQHQGYGRKLLAYALAEAKKKGMGIIYLEVRRSNRHAIALYDKMGFIQISERKNYYPAATGKKEDALVFAKDLGV